MRTTTDNTFGRRFLAAVWLVLCLSGTLLLVHHPMLLSGLARMQADPGDTRFNNYCLEHSYLWFKQASLHDRLWDPPCFYPKGNAAAYSDLLLGFAPLYWPWRMAGIAPDTAFQLWMLTVTAANFLAACFFLRGVFRVGLLPASLAAVFFAGANSLIAQMGHQQLLCQFYVIGALAAVFMVFKPAPEGGSDAAQPKQWLPGALCFGCLTLQFYGGFYFGFFVVLVLGVTVLCALAVRQDRLRLVGFCRMNGLPLAVCGLLAVAAMVPWLIHYLAAMKEVGHRGFGLVPQMHSWINMGPDNWLYGRSVGLGLFSQLKMEHEHRLGIGLVTPLAGIAGLFLCRRAPGMRILIATTVLVMLLVTQFNLFGLPSAWWLVYWVVPGANAIRVVTRIGILLIIPISIGIAFLLDHLFSKKKMVFKGAGGVVAAVCILEQFSATMPSYDKKAIREEVSKIASEVKPACEAFFYTQRQPDIIPQIHSHLDAMWAGLLVGKPTINGYSGNAPTNWNFFYPVSDTDFCQRKNDQSLRLWLGHRGLDARNIHWVGRQEFGPSVPVLLPADEELKINEKPGIGLLGDGWSYPEPEGVWSESAVADLVFSVPAEVASRGRYRLVLSFHAFAPKPQYAQQFGVFLNGTCVCSYRATNDRFQSVFINLESGQLSQTNLVQLQFGSPRSPRSLGMHQDDRLFGLLLRSVRLMAIGNTAR